MVDGKEKMYTPTEAAITNSISFGLDKKKEISHSVKKKKKAFCYTINFELVIHSLVYLNDLAVDCLVDPSFVAIP